MKLIVPDGAIKNRKRLGRGQGSGTGCTAGKGTKGQKARSGKKLRPGFEGGQMPLYRRIPRRGFSNYPFKKIAEEVTLSDLNRHFNAGDDVTVELLYLKKLVTAHVTFIKVLNTGELDKAVNLKEGIQTTKTAKEKIIALGGSVAENKETKVSDDANNQTERGTE